MKLTRIFFCVLETTSPRRNMTGTAQMATHPPITPARPSFIYISNKVSPTCMQRWDNSTIHQFTIQHHQSTCRQRWAISTINQLKIPSIPPIDRGGTSQKYINLFYNTISSTCEHRWDIIIRLFSLETGIKVV